MRLTRLRVEQLRRFRQPLELIDFEPGLNILAGPNEAGKSTLVRAIAGLWPWGGGSVNFHPDRRMFMLPQKPYVPSGTLRRAAAYPAAADLAARARESRAVRSLSPDSACD